MPHRISTSLACLVLACSACADAPRRSAITADASPPVEAPQTRIPATVVEVADGRVLDPPAVESMEPSVVDLVSMAADAGLPPTARRIGILQYGPTEIVGVAHGTFTGSGAPELAVLYSVQSLLTDKDVSGLAVLDGDRVLRNVSVESGMELRALSDVDGDGRDELVIHGSGMNMGILVSSVLFAELADTGLDAWGRAFIYEDDCGASMTGAQATRLRVVPGAVPVFQAERFESPGACEGDDTWTAAGEASDARLEPANDTFAELPTSR